jgi:hypothetical protein
MYRGILKAVRAGGIMLIIDGNDEPVKTFDI